MSYAIHRSRYGSSNAFKLEFQGSFDNPAGLQTYEYLDIPVGKANAKRLVIVGVNYQDNNAIAAPAPSLTINGVAAAIFASNGIGTSNNMLSACYGLIVPAGNTVDIVASHGNTMSNNSISVWTLVGAAQSTPRLIDTALGNVTDINMGVMNLLDGDAVIAFGGARSNGFISLTGSNQLVQRTAKAIESSFTFSAWDIPNAVAASPEWHSVLNTVHSTIICVWNGGVAVQPFAPVNSTPPEIMQEGGQPGQTELPVGATLETTDGLWAGSPRPTYTYQWKRNGSAIVGEVNATYASSAPDTNAVITCDVTATNSEGAVTVGSNSITMRAAPINTGAPEIFGDPVVGEMLNVSNGEWEPVPVITGYTYQWKRNGVNIGGATAAEYTLVSGDSGATISAEVTAASASGSTTVAATGVIIGTLPSYTVAPSTSLNGEAIPGTVITLSPGTWTGDPVPVVTQQWMSNGAPIAGQTGLTYTILEADVGFSISCQVTGTNAYGALSFVTEGVLVQEAGGGEPVLIQTITLDTPGSIPYTPGPGTDFIIVKMWGGGGGGGSNSHNSATNNRPGAGGGGGGGYATFTLDVAGQTFPATAIVGAGGAGGDRTSNNAFVDCSGKAGGNSSLLGTTAYGGGLGACNVGVGQVSGGGGGGAGTTQVGGNASTTGAADAGTGGSVGGGAGGRGRDTDSGVGNPGSAATDNNAGGGGGGGGRQYATSGSNGTGGTGGNAVNGGGGGGGGAAGSNNSNVGPGGTSTNGGKGGNGCQWWQGAQRIPPQDGEQPGGGGGGAGNYDAADEYPGGDGGDGMIIIEEWGGSSGGGTPPPWTPTGVYTPGQSSQYTYKGYSDNGTDTPYGSYTGTPIAAEDIYVKSDGNATTKDDMRIGTIPQGKINNADSILVDWWDPVGQERFGPYTIPWVQSFNRYGANVAGADDFFTAKLGQALDFYYQENIPAPPVGGERFEGHGADANVSGGDGGPVIYVTNGNNSGAGSLREALDKAGKRVILFKVKRVTLTSDLTVNNGQFSMYGQWCGGVEIRHRVIKFRCDDFIVQGCAFRNGGVSEADNISAGLSTDAGSRSIFDHCSFQWGVDENAEWIYKCVDSTISNCIVGQGLVDSVHSKGLHSMGLLMVGGGGRWSDRVSIIKNLFCYNNDRNPWIKSGTEIEIVNNQGYGLGQWNDMMSRLGNHQSSEPPHSPMAINFYNNHYQESQESRSITKAVSVQNTYASPNDFYIAGNIFLTDGGANITPYGGGSVNDVSTTVKAYPGSTYSAMAASAVPSYIQANVGVYPPRPDPVDAYQLDLVARKQNGLVDSPADAMGSWPSPYAFTAPLDTDGDGVPDDREGTYTNLIDYLDALMSGAENPYRATP